MALSDQEYLEIEALRDATTLLMLPKEALIASIKYLAEIILNDRPPSGPPPNRDQRIR